MNVAIDGNNRTLHHHVAPPDADREARKEGLRGASDLKERASGLAGYAHLTGADNQWLSRFD